MSSFLALLSCGVPAICRLGALRTCSLAAVRTPMFIEFRVGTIVCKQKRRAASSSAEDDERKKLLASLNSGMNSWSNFDDDAKKIKPASKNAARQTTKRKGKDGKLYLRDGPKRPKTVSKLDKRRMSTSSADGVPTPDIDDARAGSKVRIEESKSGGAGKKTTIIRGIPAGAAKPLLKELKAALSVGGRVNADGHVEV